VWFSSAKGKPEPSVAGRGLRDRGEVEQGHENSRKAVREAIHDAAGLALSGAHSSTTAQSLSWMVLCCLPGVTLYVASADNQLGAAPHHVHRTRLGTPAQLQLQILQTKADMPAPHIAPPLYDGESSSTPVSPANEARRSPPKVGKRPSHHVKMDHVKNRFSSCGMGSFCLSSGAALCFLTAQMSELIRNSAMILALIHRFDSQAALGQLHQQHHAALWVLGTQGPKAGHLF